MKAVLVATEQEEVDFLGFVLRRNGLVVSQLADWQKLHSLVSEQPVDLILLSESYHPELPRQIESVRTLTQAPLILTADPPTEAQECALLDAGADLVLKRPLSFRLLSRYVRMMLRRAGTVPASVLSAIDAAGLILDPASRTVTVAGTAKHLTPLEFRLLYVFMTNPDQVIPVDVIVERVWGYSGAGSRDLVRGLVRRLRLKIEPDGGQPKYIQNIPGVGYRFHLLQ